jgi:hypothetical protein
MSQLSFEGLERERKLPSKNKVEWTGKSAKERVIAFEHLLDDPITKSDFVQFREELLEAFRDLLPPKTPPKNYIGRDYG